MPDPFRLTTGDPRFDPLRPVTVNGFLFLPADGAKRSGRVPPREMKRLRAIERVREMADG